MKFQAKNPMSQFSLLSGFKYLAPLLALTLVVSPLAPVSAASADSVTAWHLQNTLSPSEQWSGVAFESGQLFASARNSQSNSLMASTDGANWGMNFENYAGDSFNAITVCNSNAVEVGDHNTFVMHPDGGGSGPIGGAPEVNSNIWNAVTCGPNYNLVAVGAGSNSYRAITSSDGINWAAQTAPALDWTSVAYGNGRYVAVASSGAGNRVMTSADGITWTSQLSAADNDWTSVTFGNGRFVAVAKSGQGNRVMTSENGINWTARASAADNDWTSVAYGNGYFVAVSSNSNSTGPSTSSSVMQSADGINWTSLDSPAQTWTGITFGNGQFVAVSSDGGSQQVMTSTSGGTLTASKQTLWSGSGNQGAVSRITTTYPSSYLVQTYLRDADPRSYCYDPDTADHFIADLPRGPIATQLEDIYSSYTCSGTTTWVVKIFDPNDPAVISALVSDPRDKWGTPIIPFDTPSLASVTVEIAPGTSTTINCEGGGQYQVDANGLAYDGSSCAGDLAGHLTLDPSVTEVVSYGFYGASFTSLTIPDSVTRIGQRAFYDVPLTELNLGSGVVDIETKAFSGSSPTSGAQLVSLDIPDSVVTIGNNAFDISPITQLTLGNSVESIGSGAFRNAHLTNLVIPDSVKNIDYLAFFNSPLTNLTLGSSLRSIGQEAFSTFNGASLELPASLISIGNYAFESAPELRSLSIYSPDIDLGIDTFDASYNLQCVNNFGGANITHDMLATALLPDLCGGNFTIGASAGSNGTINNGSVAFTPLSTPTFVITPANGYQVDSVLVDNADASSQLTTVSGHIVSYTFSALQANHNIVATFKPVSSSPPPPPPGPTTYNVYFTNLGGYVSQGGGIAGAVINCPSAPARPGYTFKGWGSCAAGGTYTITGNITLEAQWEKTTVAVTFTSNGSTVNTQNPTPGSVIDCPAAPTRAGYTFIGWPGCVDGKYTVTGAATIDAAWDKTAYPVTFTSNGSTVNSVNATVGSVIDCPAAPTRVGYTFLGWPGCVDGKYTVTGAETIEAQWVEITVPTPTPPDAGGGQTGQQARQTTVTKSVFFSPNSVTLSKATVRAISNLVAGIPSGTSKLAARIVGFAFPINGAAASKMISNRRANNIAVLLKKLGVKGNFTVIGAGRDKVADPTARRVDVAITYTELVTAP